MTTRLARVTALRARAAALLQDMHALAADATTIEERALILAWTAFCEQLVATGDQVEAAVARASMLRAAQVAQALRQKGNGHEPRR
jgi:hypothetical protein